MSERGTGHARSFLEKFEGRTNRVDRKGLQGVLFQRNEPAAKNQKDPDYLKPVDLDTLIPSSPRKTVR